MVTYELDEVNTFVGFVAASELGKANKGGSIASPLVVKQAGIERGFDGKIKSNE